MSDVQEAGMKKSWWISIFLVLVILCCIGAGLYFLLSHVPKFYESAAQAPGTVREESSHEFETRIFTLMNDFSSQKQWKFGCTTEQINSYLSEDFLKSNLSKLLPVHVSDLRLQLLHDEMQLGFKYGQDHLQSVISMKVKAWLPQGERNSLVVQVLSLQAGAMPIAVKALQEEIAEQLRSQNIKALWYRHEGYPTVVLRFQSDRREPSFHFHRLEIRAGQFYIEGITLDPEAPKRTVEGITRESP